MYVIKRDGRKEAVKFDKITARVQKLAYGLSPLVDPIDVAKKVVEGIYDGVPTTELDNLAAETAASLTTKHPDLTTTDIRYLSYVYMNLDTKEIATLLHITPVACRKRKERIEKRLEFPHDMTLNTYLLNL